MFTDLLTPETSSLEKSHVMFMRHTTGIGGGGVKKKMIKVRKIVLLSASIKLSFNNLLEGRRET